MIVGYVDGAGQVGSQIRVREWKGAKAFQKVEIAHLSAPAKGVPGPPKFSLVYDAPEGCREITIFPALISWEAGSTQYGNISTVKEPALNGASITTTKPEPAPAGAAQ